MHIWPETSEEKQFAHVAISATRAVVPKESLTFLLCRSVQFAQQANVNIHHHHCDHQAQHDELVADAPMKLVVPVLWVDVNVTADLGAVDAGMDGVAQALQLAQVEVAQHSEPENLQEPRVEKKGKPIKI